MKNILILASLTFVLVLKGTTLSAQTPEATFVAGNSLQKIDIIRLQIKDDLKLAESKFDSVSVIQKDYQAKVKQVSQDKKLTEPLKQKRLKELSEAKSKHLKAAGLDEAEVKKVETYFQRKSFP